jgi:hypothetical protein
LPGDRNPLLGNAQGCLGALGDELAFMLCYGRQDCYGQTVGIGQITGDKFNARPLQPSQEVSITG